MALACGHRQRGVLIADLAHPHGADRLFTADQGVEDAPLAAIGSDTPGPMASLAGELETSGYEPASGIGPQPAALLEGTGPQ